ncbi:MAG: phosphoribosyltransferase family protein [Acidimicrobiia bacterium]
MGFRNRLEAGTRLADVLVGEDRGEAVVLALPRGGVPVAAAVAARLGAPLDVLVVRKVGAPMQPELGVGAVGEGGAIVLNKSLLRRLGLTGADLEVTIAHERDEVERRVRAFRSPGAAPVPVEGRTVLVVDDGLATGATAEVAAAVVRERGAARLVLAVPVGPPDTVEHMSRVYDEVVCLDTPPGFRAVGQFYEDFRQLSDADVAAALAAARDG